MCVNWQQMLGRVFKTSRRSPERVLAFRPRVEALEDRLTPATFTDSGATLNLVLNVANTSAAIVSGGTNYTVTLTGDTWSGTNDAKVTGNGTAALTVTAAGIAAFTSQISLVDAAAGGDSVTFNDSGVNAYANNLSVNLSNAAAGSIQFNGTTSFLGTSTLTASTTDSISVNSGATVQTTAGNLTLTATGAVAGNYVGININGGTVQSGTGGVRLQGTGGNTANGNYGVLVFGGGKVQTTGSGTVTVQGTGGGGTGNTNIGIELAGSGSTITSGGGSVAVTGQGGGTLISASNDGVILFNGPVVTAGGSGTVTVQGTGGGGTGSANIGVDLGGSGSTITSTGGNVSVTGQGGNGSGGASAGVLLSNGAILTAGGSGSTVTVQGTGGAGAGALNYGVYLTDSGTTITSAGGNVSVTGQSGAGGAAPSEGILLSSGAMVTAGGSGTVTVQGTGAGGGNLGVYLGGSGSTITSAGGNVSVVGQGGGGATGGDGVALVSGAVVTAGGIGTVTVQGTGGAGASTTGVNIAAGCHVTTAGGNVTLTGTGVGATGTVDIEGVVSVPSGQTLTLMGTGVTVGATFLSGTYNLVVSSTGVTNFTNSIGTPTALASVSITTATLVAGGIATTGGVTVNDSGAGTINGAVTGAGATFTKQGIGTLTLTGASSTYTGATTVSAGTLLVYDNQSAATGAVAVNSGGSLGGTGILGGSVTVNAGGTITGGTLGGVGTLTVGGLNFNGGAYAADFSGNTSDTIATAGTVNLNAGSPGTFTVNSQAGTATAGTVFTLINNTGPVAISNPPLTNAPESGGATIDGEAGTFSYHGGNGQSLVFQPPPTLTAGSVTTATPGVEGGSSAAIRVTFTSSNAGEPSTDFSGTIDWGDGTAQNPDVTPFTSAAVTGSNGTYTVNASHTYAEEGIDNIKVTISGPQSSTTTATGSTTVSDPAVSVTAAGALTATEAVGLTNVPVATFTDPGGAEATADYSATIDWGDGTVSAGTVSLSGGAFTVGGSHAYAEDGNYGPSVTVGHEAAPAATASGSVSVQDPLGISYSAASKTVTITGSVFSFTQSTAPNGTTHTYTFWIENSAGQFVTDDFTSAQLQHAVVNGTGGGASATVFTNDTYVGTDSQVHETAEGYVFGAQDGSNAGMGAMYQGGLGGTLFMTLNGFANQYVKEGTLDQAALYGANGYYNNYVTQGQNVYMDVYVANAAHQLTSLPFTYQVQRQGSAPVTGTGYILGIAAPSPASGMHDTAFYYDGSNGGSQLVISGASYSYMQGDDGGQFFFDRADGFQFNIGYFTHSGGTVTLYDSASSDNLISEAAQPNAPTGSTPNFTYMYADDASGNLIEYDRAEGYAVLEAYSFVGGYDTAQNGDAAAHTNGFHVLSGHPNG